MQDKIKHENQLCLIEHIKNLAQIEKEEHLKQAITYLKLKLKLMTMEQGSTGEQLKR